MDVYSAYQDQYIGSVVRVWRREDRSGSAPRRGAAGDQTGSSPEYALGAAQSNPNLIHEEGRDVDPTWFVGSKQLGEELGPFPTMPVGNTGPIKQSASQNYATEPGDELANVAYFAVRPGRINLGPLTRLLYVPTAAVISVSMDRIVLDVQRSQIPDTWRRSPGA
jgi:hypothetical protein